MVCMFAKMAGLRNETWLIEDWLRLDIAEKIRYTVRAGGFKPPFDWLNGMKENSLFIAEF